MLLHLLYQLQHLGCLLALLSTSVYISRTKATPLPKCSDIVFMNCVTSLRTRPTISYLLMVLKKVTELQLLWFIETILSVLDYQIQQASSKLNYMPFCVRQCGLTLKRKEFCNLFRFYGKPAVDGFNLNSDLVQKLLKDYTILSKNGKNIVLCRSQVMWESLTMNKTLGCRRETARRFVSLNILLSHLRSFEMTLLSWACLSPYQYSIETMTVYRTVFENSASMYGVTLKPGILSFNVIENGAI